MDDYKEKKYELGSIVTARRTYNREIIIGEFGGFHLLDKSNPKSIVGVVHTSNGSYDVGPNSIESVISEDEKIRKDCIKYLDWEYQHCPSNEDKIKIERCVAWLEKQKENKWSKEDEKRIERIVSFIWKNRKGDTDEIYQQEQDANWLKSLKLQPKQGETLESIKHKEAMLDCQTCALYKKECNPDKNIFKCSYPIKCNAQDEGKKPIEEANGEDYGIDGLYTALDILQKTCGKVDGYQTDDGILEHQCAITAVKKLYKQKSTWSEEDEKMENLIIKTLTSMGTLNLERYYQMNLDEVKDWFKTLKPRPKQEWSEEDEKMIRAICCYLNEFGNWLSDKNDEKSQSVYKACDWFKSIK